MLPFFQLDQYLGCSKTSNHIQPVGYMEEFISSGATRLYARLSFPSMVHPMRILIEVPRGLRRSTMDGHEKALGCLGPIDNGCIRLRTSYKIKGAFFMSLVLLPVLRVHGIRHTWWIYPLPPEVSWVFQVMWPLRGEQLRISLPVNPNAARNLGTQRIVGIVRNHYIVSRIELAQD